MLPLAIAEQRTSALRLRVGMLRIEVPARDLYAAGFELRVDGKIIDREAANSSMKWEPPKLASGA